MPSWDRVSGSGDKGSDKPQEPKVPRLPTYEPPPASYERGTANREGTGRQDGNQGNAEGTRTRETPPEQGNRGREGTAAGNGASRDNGTVSQALFDQQGKIIETWKERVDSLHGEVTELRDLTEALEDRLEEKDEFIGQLQDENGRLRAELAAKNDHAVEVSETAGETDAAETTDQGTDKSAERIAQLEKELAEAKTANGKLSATNGRLVEANSKLTETISGLSDTISKLLGRAEKAESEAGKGKDQLGEGDDQGTRQPPAGRYEADAAAQDGKSISSRRERKGVSLPSDKATGALLGVLGAGDAIAVAAHGLTTGETTVIGAVGVAVAGLYLWGKNAYEGRQERKRNADKQEN